MEIDWDAPFKAEDIDEDYINDIAKGFRGRLYILKNNTPVLVGDINEWSRWFDGKNRIVQQEKVGPFFISTVFLGLDFFDDPEPLLFETMVFFDDSVVGGPVQFRSWDEAMSGHEVIKKKILDQKEGFLLYTIKKRGTRWKNALLNRLKELWQKLRLR